MDSTSTWLGLGAAGGLAAACWSRLKDYLQRFISIFVVSIELHSDLDEAVSTYCQKHFRRSPLGGRKLSSLLCVVRAQQECKVVAFELVGKERVVFWKGWRPLSLQRVSDGKSVGVSEGCTHLRLTYIRGLYHYRSFLWEALEYHNQLRHRLNNDCSRFSVLRIHGLPDRNNQIGNDGDSPSSLPPTSSGQSVALESYHFLHYKASELGFSEEEPWLGLAFAQQQLQALQEARHWLASRDWYQRHRVPWRLGLLFHGEPGSGKTSFAVAVAKDLRIPIFLYDLATLSNYEFTRAWSQARNQTPCMVLLEDFDAVFEGRRNLSTPSQHRDPLTFECLLNCLSGAEGSEGILTVFTANHPEKLDPAIGVMDGSGRSSRPGRVDRIVEFGTLAEPERRQVALHLLDQQPELVEETVEAGEGETGAQFVYRCSQLALNHFWAQEKPCARARGQVAQGANGHLPKATTLLGRPFSDVAR